MKQRRIEIKKDEEKDFTRRPLKGRGYGDTESSEGRKTD